MSTNDTKTEAVIRSLSPRLQAEARHAQKDLKQEAAEANTRAVIDEIERLANEKDSPLSTVERLLADAPVPAAPPPVERTAPPVTDDIIADANALGDRAVAETPDPNADINLEAERLGEGA